MRELRGGLLAQLRDAVGLLPVSLLGGMQGLLQRGQVLLLLQRLPALLALLPKGGQLLGLLVQASRQGQPIGNALLQHVQAGGVQIGARQKSLQIAGHFFDLDVGAIQRLRPFAVFGGDGALRLQGAVRLVQAVQHARMFVLQQQAAAFCGVQQFFGVGQAAVFFVQRFPLAGGRVQALNFLQLPLQALAHLLALRQALPGLLQLLLGVRPVLPATGYGSGVDLAVGIQQLPGAGRLQQALPGVLAVNIYQHSAQRAQLGGGNGRAVDPATAFALGVDGAAQQKFVMRIGVNAHFVEQGSGGGAGIECGADVGLGRAFAHDLRFGARAHDQLQRLQQNGFAGAGFAREHIEAFLQLQLQRFDQHEVAQDDASQSHGQALPLFQCSFSRSMSK